MKGHQELLFEIGCEEIPSRFMEDAMRKLQHEAAAIFAENRLKHGAIQAFGTPRRLTLLVQDLASEQPDLEETIKGPPVSKAFDQQGLPTKALEGFLKGQNASPADLSEDIIKAAPYVVLKRQVKGRLSEDLLPELLPRIIQKISFPRPMFWHSKEVRFARPIRWLLAIFGEKVINFSYAGIDAGGFTRGHRFLAPGPFKVKNSADYFKTLADNYVVLDQEKRREMIKTQLAEIALQNGGKALIDNELLNEVVYLVEYPVAIAGSFAENYLDLPKEVLVTTMQYHQRYFPLVEKEGEKLLPAFVGVSNNTFHPNIRKGYEKVLQARLADARFFFDEDRKRPLSAYVADLKSVVFLESLGTIDQKRQRLIGLVEQMGSTLSFTAEEIEAARRAAHLCKADLVTGLVKEFTELQGVMGREYAFLSGETETVSKAICEHYLPRFAGDILPSGRVGALVSLADRIDTLAGCFAIGIQPTGSQDPYALRRQAAGAIAILHAFEFELALDSYIEKGLEAVSANVSIVPAQRSSLQADLLEFMVQRIRHLFQEEAISYDVSEAVLAVPFAAVGALCRKAADLEEYLKGPLLDDVIVAYNRVANLGRKAAGNEVLPALLTEKAEIALYSAYLKADEKEKSLSGTAELLELLQSLKGPVDDFFDSVMVMVDEEELRENRLNLLKKLADLFNRLADFSKLQSP